MEHRIFASCQALRGTRRARSSRPISPSAPIAGEHILLIDDIFDEGITIKAIIDELKAQNPQSLRSAVLLNKKHERKVADYKPDFVGCEVEDRYIYGCGMDYHGYLRHLPGIYALKQA